MINHPSTQAVRDYCLQLQTNLCNAIETEDGTAKFQIDNWTYAEKRGGGRTAVIANGALIEQGGINFSHVRGDHLPASARERRVSVDPTPFEAMGVSLVLHPHNPFVPTTHMNVRFIMTTSPDQAPMWWFGGGFDLTPYYPNIEDCIHWHTTAKAACDPFGENVYKKYKNACDEYFYLKHRNEARGIGGLFFDDLYEWGFDPSFAFMRSIGDNFLKAYLPIVQKK